jgi:hypothetical protein
MCEGVEPDEETRASEREREAAPFGTSHRHRPLVFLLSTSPTPPRPPTMLGRRGIFKKEKKYHKLVDVLFPAELDAPIVAYAPIVTIREREREREPHAVVNLHLRFVLTSTTCLYLRHHLGNLTHYASITPNKLQKIGKYIEKKARDDLKKGRTKYASAHQRLSLATCRAVW